MDLKKFLPNQDKRADVEHFWALSIEPGWVQAAVWRIVDDQAHVLYASPVSAWEEDEELISASDAALSSAVQNFPEDVKEPSKTVFGVVSSWVADGEIKEEYLEKIKKLCGELSLIPVGFVVLSEAIAHYYKAKEGASLNAVVLGLYEEFVEVSVFNMGNLTGSTKVARSVSLVDDVSEGLSRVLSGNSVPSRFILYDGKESELETARQDLIKVNWDDFPNFKFLHTPKVEIVDPEEKVNAIALAGASEMANVSKIKAPVKIETAEELNDLEEKPIEEDNFTSKVTSKDLGFVVDEDIEKVRRNEDEQVEPNEPELRINDETSNNMPVNAVKQDMPVDEIKPEKPPKIGLLTNTISRLKPRLKFPSPFKKFGSVANRAVIFAVLFFVLILAGIFAAWWFAPRATITIYVAPKKLEEKVDIVVDPNAQEADIANRIIPGEILKASVEGDKTKSTTGTKTVGEKAKGEVTIYRTGPQINLTAGTVLHGPESLKFTLDNDTQVSSGSASSIGQTKASVTAEDIGAQYNLASGTSFSIGNYSASDIEAKNESSFSGGSSREITAVSKEDQTELTSDLIDELKSKAKNDLLDNLSDNRIFIDESVVATASSTTFSSKVGDEASTLKLTMDMDIQALAVDKDKLVSLAQDILKDKVPSGFLLRGEQITPNFQFEKQEKGIYKMTTTFDANLLPQVDPLEIAKKIAGKYPTLAEDYLVKEISGFSRAEIKIKPNFPGRLGTLPHLSKNIDVIISAEK